MSRHKANRYELGEDFPVSPTYMVVYPPREVRVKAVKVTKTVRKGTLVRS